MSKKESKVQAIKDQYTKYGEAVFRMAVTHLFQKGTERIKEEDVEASCRAVRRNTPHNSIVSANMLEEVVRCASELAQFDLWDILLYVKAYLEIGGVTVHPGVTVYLYDRKSGAYITNFLLNAEVDISELGEVQAALDSKMDKNLSLVRRNQTKAALLDSVLEEAGYFINEPHIDFEFYA